MPEISTVITVLIIERPLCLQCISDKAQVSVRTVRDYLDKLDTTMGIKRAANDRCRGCGATVNTFSLPAGTRPL